MAAAVAAGMEPAAAASGRRTLPPGAIEPVPSPGISLHVPRDGRLFGDGFADAVTGYRFTPQVGFGAAARYPAPGQVLLVFGLDGPETGTTPSGGSGVGGSGTTGATGTTTAAPTATLVVDGAADLLPGSVAGGLHYFLASVPSSAHQVELQLAASGFAQAFSFRAGRRVGFGPPALYRSPSDWRAVDPVDLSAVFPTPDPSDGLAGAAVDVTVSSAALTWFGPSGPPPSPGDAWVVLSASSAPTAAGPATPFNGLNYLSTLAGDQVTLEMSPYDLTKGRITYRHLNRQSGAPAPRRRR